jgi:hypothetical protein
MRGAADLPPRFYGEHAQVAWGRSPRTCLAWRPPGSVPGPWKPVAAVFGQRCETAFVVCASCRLLSLPKKLPILVGLLRARLVRPIAGFVS